MLLATEDEIRNLFRPPPGCPDTPCVLRRTVLPVVAEFHRSPSDITKPFTHSPTVCVIATTQRAMKRCSPITFQGAIACARAMKKLRAVSRSSPQATLITIARSSGAYITGIKNVAETTNLAANVASVASQIRLMGMLFFD